jgi:hypothetical protein
LSCSKNPNESLEGLKFFSLMRKSTIRSDDPRMAQHVNAVKSLSMAELRSVCKKHCVIATRHISKKNLGDKFLWHIKQCSKPSGCNSKLALDDENEKIEPEVLEERP